MAQEFFERSGIGDPFTLMSEEFPEIFNVTIKVRENYRQLNHLDSLATREANVKILQYILRCLMADMRLYAMIPAADMDHDEVLTARKNFARLFRQCDALNILPTPQLGIIRTSYPMQMHPISTRMRSVIENVSLRQRSSVLEVVSDHCKNFVVYTANFGITAEVSLPTISIVLPKLDSEDALACISQIQNRFDPFNFSALLIRFSTGRIQPVGQIWHYPRVPIGASISPDEPDKFESGAGTLGCYCTAKPDTGEIYALTAGHVARPIPDASITNVYAPASKPYDEALKSAEIELKAAMRTNSGVKRWSTIHEKLVQLDRLFARVIVSSTSTDTTAPYRKVDFALLHVQGDRDADNRLAKIPEFADNFPFHPGVQDSDKIAMISSPIRKDEEVWKLGIRTRLTRGTIIDDISVRWHPELTDQLEENDSLWQSIPVSSAYAILGTALPDGNFEEFANPGDSGSVVLRFVKEDLPAAEGPRITRSECVGILYGIVFEENCKNFVAAYIPIHDVLDQIKVRSGLEIGFDVPDREEEEWVYETLGRGRSLYDLH
jgi:hypothetical protein